jgi:hypothetical protein
VPRVPHVLIVLWVGHGKRPLTFSLLISVCADANVITSIYNSDDGHQTEATVAVAPGYWRPPNDTSLTFLKCLRPTNCLGGDIGCAPDRIGPLCALCTYPFHISDIPYIYYIHYLLTFIYLHACQNRYGWHIRLTR